MSRMIKRLAPIAAALMLGACAGDNMPNLFQTASTTPPAEETAAPTPPRAARVDTACLALAGQIEALRKDGSIDRLEKVAAGKSESVQVKRAAIAKQAELNKANADYQSKCGPRMPQQAAVAPAMAAKQGTGSGVTAVPSAPASAKTP